MPPRLSAVPGEIRRALVVLVVAGSVVGPVTRVTAASPQQAVPAAPALRLAAQDLPDPQLPSTIPYVDAAAKLSFVPPSGWVRSPASALNPQSWPVDPVLEVVRYQIAVGDPTLYAQPIPLTSGLVLDAKAVLSVGLVRDESELADLQIDPRIERAGSVPGFVTTDEEAVYEGLHTLTRYYVARDTERRIVARAVAGADDWDALLPAIQASLASLRADPNGPNAPAAPPPPPPPAIVEAVAPAAPTAVVDESLALRDAILARAASMLGTPYVWGGNIAGRGMDCSAYVSRAWGVARYTTDSIWAVASAISKEDLRPGDAMDLTIGRDAEGFGHIRLFEAWANDAHTAVWVYEETPPRAVHRVVAYDARYVPIRLDGLSGAGIAAVVPAPVSEPERAFVPTASRATRPAASAPSGATQRPAGFRPTYTYRPPTYAPRPAYTPRPTATVRPSTPRPTLDPRPATPTSTIRPAVRATATVAPRASATRPPPTHRRD